MLWNYPKHLIRIPPMTFMIGEYETEQTQAGGPPSHETHTAPNRIHIGACVSRSTGLPYEETLTSPGVLGHGL